MFLKKINKINLWQARVMKKREKIQVIKIQNKKEGKSAHTRLFNN